MPITAKQLERRVKHIGASDMAAIMGLHPFQNAYDVWLEKTGKLTPSESTPAAAKAGQYLEVSILDWAQDVLGKLVRNQYRSAKAYGLPFGSNIDALTADDIPTEAKSTGILGPAYGDWGDELTDHVPPHTIVQTHVQMICVQRSMAYVPALIAGRGFVMFRVERDDEVADVIANAARSFWDNHVLADIPPPNILPSVETIKRIRREPESLTQVPDSLVKEWLEAKEEARQADARAKAAQRALLAALGQSEAGRYTDGLITYFEQTRGESVQRAATFRVLRHKYDRAKETL